MYKNNSISVTDMSTINDFDLISSVQLPRTNSEENLSATSSFDEIIKQRKPRRRSTFCVWTRPLEQVDVAKPICDSDAADRIEFLVSCWLPYQRELKGLQTVASERVKENYTVDSRFPLHGHDLPYLCEKCYTLTEQWYGKGKGNISAFYTWFVTLSSEIGVSAYSMKDVPQLPSNDKWLTIIDGRVRKTMLSKVRDKDAMHVRYGGVSQKQGTSAIDNTILSNVMNPLAATVLLAGRFIKKWFLSYVSKKQKRYLEILGERLYLNMGQLSPDEVRAVLYHISDSQLAEWGIVAESVSYRNLVRCGFPLKDWGQVDLKDQETIHLYLEREISERKKYKRIPNGAYKENCESFVNWCRKRPGEFYKEDKHKHLEILITGLWFGSITVIRRTEMQRFTIAKYIPLEWKRIVNLLNYDDFTESPRVVREKGTVEFSRIRINENPYAENHGMSLSGGEHLEFKSKQDLRHELNLPRDPSSRISNWYLTDIEKVLVECFYLNPGAKTKQLLLPGEEFYDVGQNPKIGSSISSTQHTQVWKGSMNDYKVISKEDKPQWVQSIRATVDVVQIGEEEDSINVKFTCFEPLFEPFLQALIDLRMKLLKHFKGPQNIDFNVKAMSNENGAYVVIITPLSQLKGDFDTTYNVDTNKFFDSKILPVPYIDTAKGVGRFMTSTTTSTDLAMIDGCGSISRLYDYCRKPGSKQVTIEFLKTLGYK